MFIILNSDTIWWSYLAIFMMKMNFEDESKFVFVIFESNVVIRFFDLPVVVGGSSVVVVAVLPIMIWFIQFLYFRVSVYIPDQKLHISDT